MPDSLIAILKRAEQHGILQRKVVKGGVTEYLSTEPGEPGTADKSQEIPEGTSDGQVQAQQDGAAVAPSESHGRIYSFVKGLYDSQPEGAMVALFPDFDFAKRLINSLDLEGLADPDELHVTLAYLGKARDLLDPLKVLGVLEGLALEHEPIPAKLGGIGLFSQESEDGKRPLYASVDAPGLAALRTELVDRLMSAGIQVETEHDFTAHMTLAYVPTGIELTGIVLPEEEFEFPEMVLGMAGKYQPVPFGLEGEKQNFLLAYPDESKTWHFVAQEHFRGKSAHLDLRLESGDYLVGWTIANQQPDAIAEPVESLAQAKAAVAEADNWKMDIATGEILPREIRGGTVRKGDLRAFPKGVEIPESWLDVEGVTDKPDPGESIPVGATRNFPGVFAIVDRGTVEHGAKKSWFAEYFIHGKKWGTQRWVFRMLGRNKQVESASGQKAADEIESRNFDDWIEVKGKRLTGKASVTTYKTHSTGKVWYRYDFEFDKPVAIPGDGENDWDIDDDSIFSISVALEADDETSLNAAKERIVQDILNSHPYEFQFRGKADVLPPGVVEEQPRSDVYWVLMQPDDATPYVLSKEAVDKGWLPPRGMSALPKAMREAVPDDLRYWEVSGKEALARRAKLAEMDVRELVGAEVKWSPDQPRDESGRFAGGGDGESRTIDPASYSRSFSESEIAAISESNRESEAMEKTQPDRPVYYLTQKDLDKVSLTVYEKNREYLDANKKKFGKAYGLKCRDAAASAMKYNPEYMRGIGQGRFDRAAGVDYTEERPGSHFNLGYYRGFSDYDRDVRGGLSVKLPPGFEKKALRENEVLQFFRDVFEELDVPDEVLRQLAVSDLPALWKLVEEGDFEAGFRESAEIDVKQAQPWRPYWLQRHWFRGPVQVRFGASDEHYDLRVKLNGKHWHLVVDGNPLTNDVLPAYEETKYSGSVTSVDGKKISVLAIGEDPVELAPGQPANPTKDTPAFIQTVDEGEARVIGEQPEFKKLEFRGGKLDGAWYFRLEEAGSQIGEFGKSGGPAVSSKFAADQPRDEMGRFAGGGGGGVSTASNVSSREASGVRSEVSEWKGARKDIAVEATKWAEAGNDLMVNRDESGRAVAVAALTPQASRKFGYPPKEKYKELISLATAEKGHGREMMQHVFENAAKSKAGIILTAAPDARGFYEKLGFHEGNQRNEFYLTAAEVKEQVGDAGKAKDEEPGNGVFAVPGKRMVEEAGSQIGEFGRSGGPETKADKTEPVKSRSGEKGVRPLFGSPGGKRVLAKTIVGLIPPHKVYVEPFAGGAAVFFSKPPELSEKEVLADADADIAFAYRTVKGLTDAEIEKLNGMEWRIGKFDEVKDSKPEGKLGRLHRWLYLRRMSQGTLGEGQDSGRLREQQQASVDRGELARSGENWTGSKAERLPLVRDRLASVQVRHADYRDSLKEWDSKDTFFYLDPPYPETNRGSSQAELRWKDEDCAAFASAVKKLKGKWLVSLQDNSANRDLFKAYHIRTVTVPTVFNTGGGKGNDRKELLIANYPLPKRVRRKSMDEIESLTFVYTCQGCKGEVASDGPLEIALCHTCAKALAWQKYLLQRHKDSAGEHYDLRVGEDLTLKLSGTLLDNMPDEAEVSKESAELKGPDNKVVNALKVTGTVPLADGEIETVDSGQARYAKVQDGHRVEFKDGKLEGVYQFGGGEPGQPAVQLLPFPVQAEGQPAEGEAPAEAAPPWLHPFPDPGVLQPFPQGQLQPFPIPPGIWQLGAGEVAEGEKVGKRLRTEKLSKLQELKQSLEDAVKWLADLVGWASYADEENQPTLLEFFKQSDCGFAVKEVSGQPWLFTWSANAFKDREGEIFSTRSLESWAAEVSKRDDKGAFNFWHIPGSDFAKKSWVGVPGRILVEAGPFLPDAKGQAARKFFSQYPDRHPTISPEGWGCSVEYRYLPEERKAKVYDNVEITRTSVLPRFAAANTWTAVKEVTDMAVTDAQKKAAEELFGKALADSILQDAEQKTKELEPNVAHKAASEEAQVESPAAEIEVKAEVEADKAKKPPADEEEADAALDEEKPKKEKKSLDQFVKAIRDVAASVKDDSAGRTAILEVADNLSEENMKDLAKDLKKAGRAVKDADQKERLAKLCEALAGDGKYPSPTEEYPYPKAKMVEEIAAELVKQFKLDLTPIGEALTQTAEALKALELRVADLEKQDALKSKTELPRFVMSMVKQASQAAETVVPEGDALSKMKPKESPVNADGSMAAAFFPTKK